MKTGDIVTAKESHGGRHKLWCLAGDKLVVKSVARLPVLMVWCERTRETFFIHADEVNS